MTPILIATATTLHALATVVFIGHPLLLSVLYLPVLSGLEHDSRAALSQISRRSRPWLYSAGLIFILTGVYLMFVDPGYKGIGDFSTPWAALMLVKHLLVVVMIGVGFWYNGIRRVGPMLVSKSGADRALAGFRQYASVMTVCGVLVLVLTALAQAQ